MVSIPFARSCLFAASLLLAPATWAQGVANATSESLITIDTYNTTSVTQQVNTFQTELKARMQGGAYLYDQTFNVAFSDPSITAAIAQAKSVLTAAGAVSFSGPTLVSSNQSTTSNTVTVQTGQTAQTPNVTVSTYIGPLTIQIGNFGTCTGLTAGPGGSVVPTGCTGGTNTSLTIAPGSEDIDTLVIEPVTINQTATTTNTTLTSQVYELDGIAAAGSPPATPAPPSVILAFLGLACLGLYAVRHRLRQVQRGQS
jgi:hypothetical protein